MAMLNVMEKQNINYQEVFRDIRQEKDRQRFNRELNEFLNELNLLEMHLRKPKHGKIDWITFMNSGGKVYFDGTF